MNQRINMLTENLESLIFLIRRETDLASLVELGKAVQAIGFQIRFIAAQEIQRESEEIGFHI